MISTLATHNTKSKTQLSDTDSDRQMGRQYRCFSIQY